jgi:hypothetical protein
MYGKCSMSREERENFLMKGDRFRESRELIYGFMLENMDDEHRMMSRNNLVMKVLGKYGQDVDISNTKYEFLMQFIITLQFSVSICMQSSVQAYTLCS